MKELRELLERIPKSTVLYIYGKEKATKTSFELSDETIRLLKLLKAKTKRTMANLVEWLVEEEAKRQNVK